MKKLSLYAVIFVSLSIFSSYYVCAREVIQFDKIANLADDNFKTTPLHTIIVTQYSNSQDKFKKIQKILDAGADINARNEDRRTPLWLTTFYGVEPEIIDLLIQYGADVTLPDIFNVTPLHNAIIKDNKVVAQLLLDAGADMKPHTIKKMITFKDDAEQSPLTMPHTAEMDEVLENAEFNLQ
jgi:ankyrin repeat protein